MMYHSDELSGLGDEERETFELGLAAYLGVGSDSVALSLDF